MKSICLNDMPLDEIERQLRQRHPYKCDRLMDIIRHINIIAETIAGTLDVNSPSKMSALQVG